MKDQSLRVRCDAIRHGIVVVTVASVLAGSLPVEGQSVTPPSSRENGKEASLAIRHEPLTCLTPDERPDVGAAVTPEPQYAAGYVFFRAANSEKKGFYYVLLEGKAGSLKANLPRPLPTTTAVAYYVQAADRSNLRKRTVQFAPPVKAGGTCPVGVAGSPPKGKGLTVGLTEAGQEPVPPGFNKADIAKVILASGAVVGIAAAIKAAGAGGAASAAGGAGGAAAGAASGSAAGAAAGVTAGAAAAGGISTGVLIAGGVAVAAGGVAAAAGAGGGSDSEPSPPSLTAGASPTSGQAPLAVQFSANASGGTSPYSYSWSFGDGGLSTMQSPAYTYRGAGSFTASVTVTDGKQKTDTKSTYVTVSGPPPLKFLEADVNWSGGGDLNVGILRGGAAVSGVTTIPAGCDASGRGRIERALLQGTAFSSGTYTQVVTAQACAGDSAGTSITGVLTVLTDQGTKCQEFFTVTAGGTWAAPQACQVVQP